MEEGLIMVISLILTFVLLALTYITAGKLAPKNPKEGDKRRIFACGEREMFTLDNFSITYFKYILVFAIFDSVPVITGLLLIFLRSSPIFYPILSLYLMIVLIACLIILR
ncbi:MAG: hypothetical protein DRN04_06780 [Thermoprotei archaeon]|nr:MAG: hypothetical protein DRN04_06780 [Thermoprotei archaeon]